MPADSVAARYAAAFFESVSPQGQAHVDAVRRELAEIAAALVRHDDLRGFLANPDVELEDKLGLIGRVLGPRLPDVESLLRLVLSMGRAESLVDVVEAFGRLADDARGVVHVIVRSARPLPEELRRRLIERMGRVEHGRTVTLDAQVDPALVGGLQVLVGQRMFDGSVATQLHVLRERLKRVRV